MSLRGLINLRILFSVFFIILLGGSLTIWKARESVQQELNHSFTLALQMVQFGLKEFSNNQHSKKEWLAQLKDLRKTRNLDIRVMDDKGKEIKEFSEKSKQDKFPPNWFIQAVNIPKSQLKKYKLDFNDGLVKHIQITADPIDEIKEAWGESTTYFWSIIVMMIVIFVAINLVFHSMLNAVKTTLKGLKQVAAGDYEDRLPHFNIREFDTIATEVNVLTDALQKSRENNQALTRHTMHIQESERRRLSHELHDEMGQSLTAVKAMAVATKQATDVTSIADSIIEICNHLSVVVRSMMKTLHPLSLSDLGLPATLKDLIVEWFRRYPQLEIELQCENAMERLDYETSIHVYRIVQECITNIVRHAEATHAVVKVRQRWENDQHQVFIYIEDNGVGGEVGIEGFGIYGMRERVESMGGNIAIASKSNQGMNIQAWMPFIKKEQNDTRQN